MFNDMISTLLTIVFLVLVFIFPQNNVVVDNILTLYTIYSLLPLLLDKINIITLIT
jgi:hypothetical protein